MCYKGKCLHCLEVETGALIYAILNVMSAALGSVMSIVGLVYTSAVVQEAVHEADRASAIDDEDLRMQSTFVAFFGIAANVVLSILVVSFCISFGFAVCLIVGLCKRKSHYVKAYFIFGVTKVVIGSAFALYAFCSNGSQFGLLVMIVNVIYVMILVMIRMSYKKFEDEVAFHRFSNPLTVIEKY